MQTKTALIAGTLALIGSIAWAQDKAPAAPDRHDMMRGGKGEMMGPGMMGDDPAQMNRMTENCNRMMESWLHNHPQTRTRPEPEKKG